MHHSSLFLDLSSPPLSPLLSPGSQWTERNRSGRCEERSLGQMDHLIASRPLGGMGCLGSPMPRLSGTLAWEHPDTLDPPEGRRIMRLCPLASLAFRAADAWLNPLGEGVVGANAAMPGTLVLGRHARRLDAAD